MIRRVQSKEYDAWSKDELIQEIIKIKSTTYGLVWHRDLPEEKIDVVVNPDANTPSEMFPNEITGKPFPVLKEVKNRAINRGDSQLNHFLIEGDNYHSLAVLNFTHRESIDVIYIDPPYNTGENDFIYNDKFVEKDDSFRHSKWLSFMERRLKLAKNLLSPTGVIFISIDDNEQAALRLLCDEIYGEDNFLGTLTWVNKTKPVNSGKARYQIQKNIEYILVYSRQKKQDYAGFDLIAQGERAYPYSDEAGVYRFVDIEDSDRGRKRRDTMKFEILGVKPAVGKRWKIGQEVVADLIRANELVRVDGKIKRKIYKIRESGIVESPFWSHLSDVGTAEVGKRELSTVLGSDHGFDTVKPIDLIKELLSHFPPHVLVLDFFAGSGTTAHALLDLNREDEGTRRFILCTNNENNICTDICYPRIERVIAGYKNQQDEKIDGLGGNLKYFVTDFVESLPTDRNRRKLVKESTDMLCILENAFESVHASPEFCIFKNADKYVGIIFYEDSIADYVDVIRNIDGCFNTYVFSMGDDPNAGAFVDVKAKITLCAIPEIILKVYRDIFK